jgi:hypothetical protein
MKVSKKAKKKPQEKSNRSKSKAQRSKKLNLWKIELIDLLSLTLLRPFKYEFSTNGANANARK